MASLFLPDSQRLLVEYENLLEMRKMSFIDEAQFRYAVETLQQEMRKLATRVSLYSPHYYPTTEISEIGSPVAVALDFFMSSEKYPQEILGSWTGYDLKPEMRPNDVIKWKLVTAERTEELTQSDRQAIQDTLNNLAQFTGNELVVRAVYSVPEDETLQVPFVPNELNAAERLWREYGGVVLCECDDLDCDREIVITHDEYIDASGPGFYRVTHADCSYGVLGSTLIVRGEHYRVYAKTL